MHAHARINNTRTRPFTVVDKITTRRVFVRAGSPWAAYTTPSVDVFGYRVAPMYMYEAPYTHAPTHIHIPLAHARAQHSPYALTTRHTGRMLSTFLCTLFLGLKGFLLILAVYGIKMCACEVQV